MEGDPKAKFDPELPDTTDDHIHNKIAQHLSGQQSLALIEKVGLFNSAPTFDKNDAMILSILMTCSSIPLKLTQILCPTGTVTEDLFETNEDLITSVKKLLIRGVIEERVLGEHKYYVVSESGAIIYKMWILASQLIGESLDP